MRLFLAIVPPASAQAAIDAACADVRGRLGADASACRWTPLENIHATLHFIGAADASQLAALRAALERPLEVPRFDVAFAEPAMFPTRGAPRVIALGVSRGFAELTSVREGLAHALREARVPVDERPFTPHLTLARVREREVRRMQGLRARVAGWRPAPAAWTVSSVTLYRSDLSGPVPRYTVEKVGDF